MTRYLLAIPAFLLLTLATVAPPALSADSDGNPAASTDSAPLSVNLNGTWKIAFDPADAGKTQHWYEQFPATAEPIRVPSVWNELRPNYQGVAWYSTTFSVPSSRPAASARIRFAAVSYRAEVWLNGTYVGAHEGGYTPFELDAEKSLLWDRPNQLVVRVLLPERTLNFMPGLKWVTGRRIDGMVLEEIPASKQIWYDNFGGIWQDVRLDLTPAIWLRDCFIRPDIYSAKADVTCTLANHSNLDASATLDIAVTTRLKPDAIEAQLSKAAVLAMGDNKVEFSVPIPHPHLWSPDDPFLYRLKVGLLANGKVVPQGQFTFGMRDFTIRENRFYLNGKPIFIKATIYQPHYPQTLAYPPDPKMLETDIRMVKAAHFNLLRLHIKPQLPHLLDLADEQGLLLYEEPPIGWIQKSDAMRERCRREVRELIERDRNHPSVVIWGALNEGAAEGEQLKAELAAYAHELDPTRLVFDDSGGVYWSGEYSHVTIPGSSASRAVNDIHPYMLQPFSNASFNYYRAMQEPHMLNYTSEFGAMGGIEDLDAVIARYPPEHEWQDQERLKEVRGIFEQGFKELGLDASFGSFSAFTKSSRDAQAEALTRMIDALRLNPLTAGYDICHWNDANFEFSFGLVDEWRNPKPSLLAAAEANRPLHVIVSRPRFNLYAGDPFASEITVVNDEGREGKGAIAFQLVSPSGKVLQREERPVSLGARIQTVGSLRLTAPAAEGDYQLRAVLRIEGEVVDVTSHRILVLKRSRPPSADFAILDSHARFHDRVAKLMPKISEFKTDGPAHKVYLVAPGAESLYDDPLGKLKALIDLAQHGASVIFFELPMDSGEVSAKFNLFPFPLKVDFPEGFKLQWIRKHAITTGLPSNLVLDQGYADVLPERFLQIKADEVVGGMLLDSFGDYRQRWLQSLTDNRVGTGHVIICQYRLLENLGRDPLADRLFANLVNYAQSIAHAPSALEPGSLAALNQQVSAERGKVRGDLQRWAVIGPFDNRDRGGLRREYPPEKEFHFAASYAGVDGAVNWKPVTVWNADGDKVVLDTRFDDWTLHYAYTQIYSPADATARIKIACQQGCRLWLDGKEILDSDVLGPNQNSTGPVRLHAGWNPILAKVDRTKMHPSSLSVEVRAENGNPLPGVLFDFAGEKLVEAKKAEPGPTKRAPNAGKPKRK